MLSDIFIRSYNVNVYVSFKSTKQTFEIADEAFKQMKNSILALQIKDRKYPKEWHGQMYVFQWNSYFYECHHRTRI